MNYQNFASISDIIGKPVHNSLAQEYGHVSDVIVSAPHKRVVAIVVKKSGFLGIGADHFVLPWGAVHVNPNTHRVLVDADRKTIEDTPLIDISKLKDGDWSAMELVYQYFGLEAFWQKAPKEDQPMKTSYSSGQDIGERLPSNEGSYQITNQYPGPKKSNTEKEVDFDKMKGYKNK